MMTVPKISARVYILLFLLLNSDFENTMVLQIDLTCLCVCLGGPGPRAFYVPGKHLLQLYPRLQILMGSQPALYPLSHLPRSFLLVTPPEDVSPCFQDKTMQAVFSHCFVYAWSVLLPFKF